MSAAGVVCVSTGTSKITLIPCVMCKLLLFPHKIDESWDLGILVSASPLKMLEMMKKETEQM